MSSWPPHLTCWHRAQSGQQPGHGRNQRGRFILLLHGVIVIGPWAPSTISRSPAEAGRLSQTWMKLERLSICTRYDMTNIYQRYKAKVMLCVLWILVILVIFGYSPTRKRCRSSFDLDHPLRFHSAGAVSSTYPPGSDPIWIISNELCFFPC